MYTANHISYTSIASTTTTNVLKSITYIDFICQYRLRYNWQAFNVYQCLYIYWLATGLPWCILICSVRCNTNWLPFDMCVKNDNVVRQKQYYKHDIMLLRIRRYTTLLCYACHKFFTIISTLRQCDIINLHTPNQIHHGKKDLIETVNNFGRFMMSWTWYDLDFMVNRTRALEYTWIRTQRTTYLHEYDEELICL